MSKKFLYSVVVVLIITNIASLLFWNKGEDNKDSVADHVDDEEIVKKIDDEVASIGDRDITYKEWMQSLRNTHGKSHLKEMINQEVVENISEEKDISISDKVIQREISFLTTMSGIMNEEEIAEQEEEWEKDLFYRYKLEALLTEDIEISEEDVQQHYDQYENQYDFSASFQLSHMIVPDEEVAEKVIEELEQGASFNLLAMEYSLDEDTLDEGGYLGYFTEGNQFIPPGYEEKINDMDEQSFSEPFSVGNDVAIIYLHRYLPEIKFTYEELQEDITRELALKELDDNTSADILWDKTNVDWVYDEEDDEALP